MGDPHIHPTKVGVNARSTSFWRPAPVYPGSKHLPLESFYRCRIWLVDPRSEPLFPCPSDVSSSST